MTSPNLYMHIIFKKSRGAEYKIPLEFNMQSVNMDNTLVGKRDYVSYAIDRNNYSLTLILQSNKTKKKLMS